MSSRSWRPRACRPAVLSIRLRHTAPVAIARLFRRSVPLSSGVAAVSSEDLSYFLQRLCISASLSFVLSDDADRSVALDIGPLHFGAVLDPLLSKLAVEFLCRDHLSTHVPGQHFSIVDQQKRRRSGEA